MNNDLFLNFILDQLNGLEAIRSRKMFGGYGIYAADIFFAIVHQQHLYMKTNERSRQHYLDMKMSYFQPNEKQALRNYYEVPLEVIENREKLYQWATDAIEVATSST